MVAICIMKYVFAVWEENLVRTFLYLKIEEKNNSIIIKYVFVKLKKSMTLNLFTINEDKEDKGELTAKMKSICLI